MSECYRRIARDQEHETDGILLSLVRVRKIDQGIYDNFHDEENLNQPVSNPRSLAHLQHWKEQLETWRGDDQTSNPQLGMIYFLYGGPKPPYLTFERTKVSGPNAHFRFSI
jgi:hypothetical protein